VSKKIRREQLRQVCRWNYDLVRELRQLRQALRESEETVARFMAEAEAGEALLASAMDAAAERQGR
jgi:hypothetical protein